MAEPKCPECGVEGAEHFVSSDSAEKSRDGKPWFAIVHCDECGYVHGVFAKHIFGPSGGPRLVVKDKN